jgi:hypothetical protein
MIKKIRIITDKKRERKGKKGNCGLDGVLNTSI